MLFGPSVLIAGGITIAISLLDKIAEDHGITWLSTSLKLFVPIAAMVASVYFLETNSLLRWLK
ncbi:hypothetical protein [Bacillus sp. EB600]|uniref:hypothetical protein n=1 Tax=Bacillus sp. EB600 TaxID=2806345 RepID=UPI00210A999F|nr:hypothetical protein [Bacillus sp. EB600]